MCLRPSMFVSVRMCTCAFACTCVCMCVYTMRVVDGAVHVGLYAHTARTYTCIVPYIRGPMSTVKCYMIVWSSALRALSLLLTARLGGSELSPVPVPVTVPGPGPVYVRVGATSTGGTRHTGRADGREARVRPCRTPNGQRATASTRLEIAALGGMIIAPGARLVAIYCTTTIAHEP